MSVLVAETPKLAAYKEERLRADFPILSPRVYGKPFVYLDNGASAQKPWAAIETAEAHTRRWVGA